MMPRSNFAPVATLVDQYGLINEWLSFADDLPAFVFKSRHFMLLVENGGMATALARSPVAERENLRTGCRCCYSRSTCQLAALTGRTSLEAG